MIFIAHAAWAADRKPSLARLLEQVPGAIVVASEVKEHSNVWALRLWRKAYEVSKPGEWCVFLNDDVTVAPDHEIERMTEYVTGDCVSLATIQKEARAAYDAGACFLASYSATGPGYAIKREALGELIEFYATKLTDGMKMRMNEDEAMAHWAWARQRPFWQCIPALVAHDVAIKSTLGYDNHPMRVASVLWTDAPPRWHAHTPEYVPHPWMGEGRMRAVRRAILNGWSFDDKCVFCAERTALIISPQTGAGLCGQCMADGVGHVLINARVG